MRAAISNYMRRAARTFCAVSAIVCGFSCAASGAGAPAARATAPALRPVPQDALQWLSGAPQSVLVLRVAALRASPLYARLTPYVERATCFDTSEWASLLDATKRAAIATRAQSGATEWLAVLEGKYTEDDARRLLHAASARVGAAPVATPTSEPAGRFTLWREGELSASLPSSGVLVLGTSGWTRSALEDVDQPKPAFVASAAWRELGPRVQCGERAACWLSAGDSELGRLLQGELENIGAEELGSQLGAAEIALGVDAADGAVLRAVADMHDAAAANGARQMLAQMLMQASLMVRFSGLPDVLGKTRLSAQAEHLSLELDVDARELAEYEQLLRRYLAQSPASCARSVASAAQ